MYLKSILSADCTQQSIELNSKKRILQFISQLAHKKCPQVSSQDILESLLVREKLGSTGIGHGIALPHGRLKGINKSVAVFVITQKAINYDAIDNKAVDIFCSVLIPEQQSQEHLATLSEIAKLLSDKSLVKKLRHTTSDEGLYELIINNAQ